MANETNGFSAWLIRIFEDLGGALTFEQALHAILERPEDFEVPLAKVLATLGSGLITAHSRGSNQSLVVDPPRG